MIKIGVYEIVNKVNNKRYIGCSKNIKERFINHLNSLKKNKHHSIKLQRAWNKYKEDSFEFNILELCELEDTFILESSYINKFDSMKNGYNMIEGALIKNIPRKNARKSKYYFKFKNMIDNFVLDYEEVKELYTTDICKYHYINLRLNHYNDAKSPIRMMKFMNMLPRLLRDFIKLNNDNKGYYMNGIHYCDKFTTNYNLVEFDIIDGKTYKEDKRTYAHDDWYTDFNHILREFLKLVYYSNHKYLMTFLDDLNILFEDKELYRDLLKFYNNNKGSE